MKNNDYRIVSPYSDVVWSGEHAWGAFKGNLHSHSTYSDADIDLATMVKEYYARGYGFLAMSDHGVTGVEWNTSPRRLLLYSYQKLTGKKVCHLTDEEFRAIGDGTYNARGEKMVCVTGANELNNHSITKNHVNAYFLPRDKGNGFGGVENEPGYIKAVEFTEKCGGLSHINHPGDWINSNRNPQAVNDPANIAFFGRLLLKYGSCMGIEVFNERNGTTGYDRVLWDNLLKYCLPYGKTVIGFANTDAHCLKNVDSSFSVFMMPENSVENIKTTMCSGAFFIQTRALRGNCFEIGPEKEFDMRLSPLPLPMFTYLCVDGHSITAQTHNAHTIQWIADGRVILKVAADGSPVVLNLDEIEGAEDLLYVRAELFGEGGMCLSQAFIIDAGREKLPFDGEICSMSKKELRKRGSKLNLVNKS